MTDNALARYGFGYVDPRLQSDSEDFNTTNVLARMPPEPYRYAVESDPAKWKSARDVFAHIDRNILGRYGPSLPEIVSAPLEAAHAIGSSPFAAPHLQDDGLNEWMLGHAGAIVGPQAGIGIGRGMTTHAPAGTTEVGIFGGRNAKTADHAKLAAAEWADKTGVPREQIWDQTGWFKGPDQKWRFEIPDKAASVTSDLNFNRRTFGNRIDEKFGDGISGPDAVFRHDELAKAYPESRDIAVSLEANKKLSGGQYGNDPNNLWAVGISPSDVRTNALHEAQHYVQDREGFATGGSVRDPNYKHLAGEAESRAVEARRDLTPEQRASRPPWLDYDVPEKDQIVRFGSSSPQMSADRPEISKGITAYHGSPHDFDRFDMSKIGTGEGAQAYGHGLYFAENEGVAKQYRDTLAANTRVGAGSIADAVNAIGQAVGASGKLTYEPIGGNRFMVFEETKPKTWISKEQRRAIGTVDEITHSISGNKKYYPHSNEPGALAKLENHGRMYEVRINADPEHFLDWDKPLSQQSEKVQKAIPEDWRDGAHGTLPEYPPWKGHAQRPEGAQALREAGIPGIKYLDQGSRGAGEGSRNYVVFDQHLIEILRKYGLLPPLAAGAAAASSPNQAQAGQ